VISEKESQAQKKIKKKIDSVATSDQVLDDAN